VPALMDDLYGDILALLALLREAGHSAGARSLLKAMTDVCSPRDVLDNLRGALGDLPGTLEPEALALKQAAEAKIESLWKDLGTW
jgi:hypothetical protein